MASSHNVRRYTLCRKSKMAANQPEVVIFRNYETYHQNSNGEPAAFDHGKLVGSVYLGDSNNERQSQMAAETRNTYISQATKGIVKIQTTLGYNIMHRCKIMLVSKYNSDQQPEMWIWPPNRKYLRLWNCDG